MSRLFRPSTLLAFLEQEGIKAKKKWSQNFLIDGNIIRKIIATAEIQNEDLLIEIGPGPGAITEALLATGNDVIAIEKDRKLATLLNRLQTPDNRLHVEIADALEIDYDDLVQGKKGKIIANLPFHITTPLLAQFICRPDLFGSLVFIVQKEVALRCVAEKNTRDYSSFTLFLSYWADTEFCFPVSRKCFCPVPKVDSAVIRLKLKKKHPLEDPTDFFTLTRTAFQQRRKMLRSSLKELYGQQKIERALLAIGSKNTARPQELSLEEFLSLYRELSHQQIEE